MDNKKHITITSILFIIYLMLLTWVIIFKMETNIADLSFYSNRTINLVPYAYLNPTEVILNIFIFIPFGIYAGMIFQKYSFFTKVILAFLLSFFYEATQYIFAIGYSDITDLIDNTLGGIIGLVGYYILKAIFSRHTNKVINAVSIMITGTVLYFLYYYNLI